MTSSTVIVMIAIAVYLIGMLAIGAAYSKRNKTSSDFYLGGRKLGPIVIAMSTEASDMSSWLLMGVPGLAYFCGLADASWTVIGLALGTYLNWLIVAKRLRIYSQKLGAITIPDFFAHRFGDKSGLIEGIAALIIIIFFVPYTASGFAACGKLFTNLFPGSSYIGTMLLSAAVIVGYCAMGGFLAASITSLIQSIVMTIALFVILIFGIHSAGGWDAVIENAKTVPGYLDLFSSTTILSTEPGKYGFISIVSTMAWGLGYFGMPHILNHFMAIDDGEKLKISRRIGSIWVVISMSVAIIIGIVGFAMSSKCRGHPGPHLRADEHLRRDPRAAGRRGAGGHPVLHHVHLRRAAAGRGLRRVPQHHPRRLPQGAGQQAGDRHRPYRGALHRRYRGLLRPRPQQLCLRNRVLRVGGLRRGLRPPDALCPVLEALQQVWRDCRHGRRRRDDLPLEVPGAPARRRMEHLRAAARLHRLEHFHRDRLPLHTGAR